MTTGLHLVPRLGMNWAVSSLTPYAFMAFAETLLPCVAVLENFSSVPKMLVGLGNSVGIATDYGLDGPGIESRWERDFPLVQTGPGAHPTSCTVGTGSFPGVNCGRGVLLSIHHLLAPRSWKSRAIPLPPLGHNRTCNGITVPFTFYLKCWTD
jgi:hypothetical protein